MKVIVLGYMASGKSTISNKLADKLEIDFIDLDTYIAKKEQSTIKEIFKNKGEIYFRKQENKYLNELLDNPKNFVLALGGGTPCYANNIELITKKSISIYLKANLNTLLKRLRVEKANRPLISNLNDEELLEFIAKHLFERTSFYDQALFKVLIDGKNVNSIVNEIQNLLS